MYTQHTVFYHASVGVQPLPQCIVKYCMLRVHK